MVKAKRKKKEIAGPESNGDSLQHSKSGRPCPFVLTQQIFKVLVGLLIAEQIAEFSIGGLIPGNFRGDLLLLVVCWN